MGSDDDVFTKRGKMVIEFAVVSTHKGDALDTLRQRFGATAVLFLGGWLPPVDTYPLDAVPGPIWLALKIAFCLFVFLWVRATFPRYRYDQLMRLGWKVFLPISLAAVAIVAGVLVAFDWLPKG